MWLKSNKHHYLSVLDICDKNAISHMKLNWCPPQVRICNLRRCETCAMRHRWARNIVSFFRIDVIQKWLIGVEPKDGNHISCAMCHVVHVAHSPNRKHLKINYNFTNRTRIGLRRYWRFHLNLGFYHWSQRKSSQRIWMSIGKTFTVWTRANAH